MQIPVLAGSPEHIENEDFVSCDNRSVVYI
jgi:hypothetical protein